MSTKRKRLIKGRINRQPITLERLLAYPFVDGLLVYVLRWPRAIQLGGVVLGVVLAVLALRPLVLPGSAPLSGAEIAAAPTSGVLTEAPSDRETVLAVVAAYNQASITAAVLNTTEPMAPLLAPDGSAWVEIQAEYARRATRGETHAPALTRWGVLAVSVQGNSATVETQEQWDDITSVGGAVIASRRGILTRNVYTLQWSASGARWQIAAVTSTTLIG